LPEVLLYLLSYGPLEETPSGKLRQLLRGELRRILEDLAIKNLLKENTLSREENGID
jgi:hypothetical protein